MPYARLDIDPTRYPVQVTVARPSGRTLDEQPGILSWRCFGVAGALAYFDPQGADPGQIAPLGYDGALGTFFLLLGVESDLHLMAVRQLEREQVRSLPAGPEPQAEDGRREIRASARSAPLSIPVHDGQLQEQRLRARRQPDVRALTDRRSTVMTPAGTQQQARRRAAGR